MLQKSNVVGNLFSERLEFAMSLRKTALLSASVLAVFLTVCDPMIAQDSEVAPNEAIVVSTDEPNEYRPEIVAVSDETQEIDEKGAAPQSLTSEENRADASSNHEKGGMQIMTKARSALADWSEMISLVVVVIGVVGGLVQWNRKIRLEKASYIRDLTDRIFTDPLIREGLSLLDFDKEWLSEDVHSSVEMETNIGKVYRTLSFFSYICYLKKRGIIGYGEILLVKDDIDRIVHNESVVIFFYNLYHSFDKKIPYTLSYLFQYAKSQRVFSSDFFDSQRYGASGGIYRKIPGFPEIMSLGFKLSNSIQDVLGVLDADSIRGRRR